jgi:predicted nucleotidyltransferase
MFGMQQAPFNLSRDYLREFCRRHGIVRVSLFGSFLHGTATPDSDLDLLVEFESLNGISLLDLAAMAEELSGRTGRRVDLRTPEDLSRYFRDQVMKEAMPLYAS